MHAELVASFESGSFGGGSSFCGASPPDESLQLRHHKQDAQQRERDTDPTPHTARLACGLLRVIVVRAVRRFLKPVPVASLYLILIFR